MIFNLGFLIYISWTIFFYKNKLESKREKKPETTKKNLKKIEK